MACLVYKQMVVYHHPRGAGVTIHLLLRLWVPLMDTNTWLRRDVLRVRWAMPSAACSTRPAGGEWHVGGAHL